MCFLYQQLGSNFLAVLLYDLQCVRDPVIAGAFSVFLYHFIIIMPSLLMSAHGSIGRKNKWLHYKMHFQYITAYLVAIIGLFQIRYRYLQ